jgi:lipopolysaccharide/colanic/teichoic acid biosynthesis glycosyltransferase
MKLPIDATIQTPLIGGRNAVIKRVFDFAFSLALLPLLVPIAVVLIIGARMSTGQSGLFKQQRVGLYGTLFTLYKIRSMKPMVGISTDVTTSHDARITRFGRFLRKTKLDEIPQLFNVLKGDMSFVGPRPDVPKTYADVGSWAEPVLRLKPGITGPASIAFRNEEQLLGQQSDPEKYNRDVVFPEKVRINLEYARKYTLLNDFVIMLKTALGKS